MLNSEQNFIKSPLIFSPLLPYEDFLSRKSHFKSYFKKGAKNINWEIF